MSSDENTRHNTLDSRPLLTEAIDQFAILDPWILAERTETDLETKLIDAWVTNVRLGTALVAARPTGESEMPSALSVGRFFRIQQGDQAIGVDVGSIGIELADLHVRHPSGGIRVLRVQIFTQQLSDRARTDFFDEVIQFFETRAKLVDANRIEFLTFDPRVARALASKGFEVAGAPLTGAPVQVTPTHRRLSELRATNTVLPFADHWQTSRAI